ncbi:MAG: hypothetical protein FGM33_03515 [Candidatus Kapabacteria bacterium]|nr:hypothetical protein [Candidatus Kapabacteria bacterium]
MSGVSMMDLPNFPKKSPEDAVDSLRNDLLSGDIERARVAAAFVRSSYDVRDQYRRNGLSLVIGIDGQMQEVDPDSPLLPDLSSLVPIVKRLFPLPAEEEPPGM